MYVITPLTRTTAQAPVAYFAGSTAGLVGKYWAITANHTNSGAFTDVFEVDDVPYTIVARYQIPTVHIPGSEEEGDPIDFDDLLLLQLAEPLPAWSRISRTKPAVGAELEAAGYGYGFKVGHEMVPFNTASDIGLGGLHHCRGNANDSEYIYNLTLPIYDSFNVIWPFSEPSVDGGDAGTGLVGKNDSGAPIWAVIGGENWLVAVANQGMGLTEADVPTDIDYHDTTHMVGATRSGGFFLGTTAGTMDQYDSPLDWIYSHLLDGRKKLFRPMLFRSRLFNCRLLAGPESGSVQTSSDTPSRQRRISRGRLSRLDRLRD